MSAEMRGHAATGDLTPGEHLRSEIERLGLDQVAVSRATGVSRQSINNIVNGRQPISRAMAGKLGRLTGQSSDYWLRASFPGTNGPVRAGAAGMAEREARPLGVGLLVNHQIVRAVKDGIIGIDPFDESHVRPASVDLTLDDFVVAAGGEETDISGGTRYRLKSGQTVNASTREWLEFPHDYIGRIGTKASLARAGLMVSHGLQIEPGFKGNLQFCIFNSGLADVELHGGQAIIGVEIMPLAATPARESGKTLSIVHDACDRLIREAIRARAQVDIGEHGAKATIADLNIEVLDASADAALDDAVQGALGGLKTLREKPNAAREDREKYAAFFGDIAERLHLTGEQAHAAIAALGLPTDAGGTMIATLRDGGEAVVPLPTRSGKVSLRQLARQLREDPLDLLLILAGAEVYDVFE